MSATDLGVIASNAAIQQAGVKPEDIKSVVMGNVIAVSITVEYKENK